MERILVIDDDSDLLDLIQRALSKTGYQVVTRNAATNVTQQDLDRSDLILLDVMMPGMDGFSFLRDHREQIDVPVLFLTAKDFEQDLLEGFASGGDDYITKPFSINELRVRVAAHLRREKREKTQRLKDGNVTVDLFKKQFYVGEQSVKLTAAEYGIALFLLQNKGQVFDKETIYVKVFGFDAAGDSQTTITERVKNIRQKFKELQIQPIKTVWGVGYQWEIVH